MLRESHTNIAIIRSYVDLWRKREGWSRETVVHFIVSAHQRINGPEITGITFSDNRDTFMRAKVNADRVYRWLDDSSKDTNLLPVNILTSILYAFPDDLKVRCVDDLLRPTGLKVKTTSSDDSACFDRIRHTQSVAKESSEAVVAMAVIEPGAPVETLLEGLRELREAESAAKKAGDDLEKMIAEKTKNA
ncbi:MAG: hypothetical protein NC211_03745 [Alistipes senegalensis]|nr:hypothetical protein [Oxalobacter formigenes]MCM1280932.1 hypothetical protein [Alistipes senegalensis]